jgi:hypothetical protein
MVALPLLTLQAPPVIVFDNVIVEPTFTLVGPENVPTAGVVLTVTIFVVRQPVGNIYEIMAVPAVRPLMRPATSVVAIAVLLLTHIPPAGMPVSEVVPPAQSKVAPVTDGAGLTVTLANVAQPVASV